jgi:hypothetical protein
MHPIAAVALARVNTLAVDDRSTVAVKWRPLISRYYSPSACWSLSPDGAYALLQDQWECLHVLPLTDSTTGIAAELTFDVPHAPHPVPAEVICSVADSGTPAALRHFLFQGRQVGHVERCNAWVQDSTTPSKASVPPEAVLRDVLPEDIPEILSHWFVLFPGGSPLCCGF